MRANRGKVELVRKIDRSRAKALHRCAVAADLRAHQRIQQNVRYWSTLRSAAVTNALVVLYGKTGIPCGQTTSIRGFFCRRQTVPFFVTNVLAFVGLGMGLNVP